MNQDVQSKRRFTIPELRGVSFTATPLAQLSLHLFLARFAVPEARVIELHPVCSCPKGYGHRR